MPEAQKHTDEGSHQTRANRQIHNEYLTDSVIAGQGTGATVTINDGVSRNSDTPADVGQLDSYSVPYPQFQEGYHVDERIFNRNNARLIIFGQGSGARANLSERFATMLMQRSAPGGANEIDEQLQRHQERQAREYQLLWEYQRTQLAYTFILTLLQVIVRQFSIAANRPVADAGIAATSHHVPPSEMFTQNSPELVGQGRTPAVVTPPCESANVELGQSEMTSPPPPPFSANQSSIQNAPSPAASAPAQTGEVLPIICILKSLKTRLTSWFSRKLKGFRKGRTV